MTDFIHGTVDASSDFDVRFGQRYAIVSDNPNSAKGATFPRHAGVAAISPLVSGTEGMFTIGLIAGSVISSISFQANNAASVPTNQWFTIRDKFRRLLAITNDDLTTAWNANSTKTLNLTTPYTVPVTDYYYLGIMVKATTAPTLLGQSSLLITNLIPPIIAGFDGVNSGLTTPATAVATAAALSAVIGKPFAWVT